jgi:hypothetical protein
MTEISKKNGYIEFIIAENCDFDIFYSSADKLKNKFKVTFAEKIDDFDTLYWIFQYKGSTFILYYNTFLGVSIYPKSAKEANGTEIQLIEDIKSQWEN